MPTTGSVVGGGGIGWVMKNQEDEINIRRNAIELFRQPLALRTGSLIERTAEHQHQRIGSAHRVIAIVLKRREAVEIIRQGNCLIAMKIVVSERRVNRDTSLPPDFSFAVPDFPVVCVVSVIGDVATDRDECWIGLGNGLNQCPAHGRTGGPSVCRIGEARVTVDDETEWDPDWGMQP